VIDDKTHYRRICSLSRIFATLIVKTNCMRAGLGDTRLHRDKKDVKDITQYLRSQCQDPFNLEKVPECLVNITTG